MATMTILPPIQEGFSRWIASVATTVNNLLQRLRTRQHLLIVEDDTDTFTLRVAHAKSSKAANKAAGKAKTAATKTAAAKSETLRIRDGRIEGPVPAAVAALVKGSSVDLVLRNPRFLFRPLELPKRAGEFLEGIVRAQIDRLTPWTAGEAVFGWTAPTEAAGERIELTIAASSRALVQPYLKAIADLGAASVTVLTTPPEAAPDAAPVRVFEQHARGVLEVGRIRQALVAVIVCSAVAAAGTMAWSTWALDSLDSEQQDLDHKIAARRAALRTGPEAAATAQRVLERRKQTTPANTIVLEALSQILPDHTYVTELRIEGDKLQVVGLTRDAAALIGLIEQSPHFEHAAFYAPTTRTPGETGERFHVEAHIKPVFAVGT